MVIQFWIMFQYASLEIFEVVHRFYSESCNYYLFLIKNIQFAKIVIQCVFVFNAFFLTCKMKKKMPYFETLSVIYSGRIIIAYVRVNRNRYMFY